MTKKVALVTKKMDVGGSALIPWLCEQSSSLDRSQEHKMRIFLEHVSGEAAMWARL